MNNIHQKYKLIKYSDYTNEEELKELIIDAMEYFNLIRPGEIRIGDINDPEELQVIFDDLGGCAYRMDDELDFDLDFEFILSNEPLGYSDIRQIANEQKLGVYLRNMYKESRTITGITDDTYTTIWYEDFKNEDELIILLQISAEELGIVLPGKLGNVATFDEIWGEIEQSGGWVYELNPEYSKVAYIISTEKLSRKDIDILVSGGIK